MMRNITTGRCGQGLGVQRRNRYPSQPPYNTISKIIPNLVPDNNLPYPLNDTWGYHDACTGNGHYDTYYKAMLDRFGKPTSIRDFSDKMQLLNAGGYRGIFEATGHKLNETGGVMLWKLNAASPASSGRSTTGTWNPMRATISCKEL